MTDAQRDELLTTLHGLAKSLELEAGGDERDTATAGCLYSLCLAISEGVEVELARYILMLDDGEDDALVSDPLTEGDSRGN